MFGILIAQFFVITFMFISIYGEEFSECDEELQGSFIAVSSNCSKAIYCNGADSTIVDCDNNNPYFSPDDEMCYNNFSICGDRPFSLESITTTLSIPTIATTGATTLGVIKPTIGSTTTIISTTKPSKATNTDLHVANTTSNAQTTPQSLHITTAFSSNIRPPVEMISSTMQPSIIVQCPGVDDPSKPLFLPHPQSCSKYYLCYHGVAALMQCPNMLHFDVLQQTCNTAERAKCQVNSVKPREQCLAHTVDVYPHPTNCNYYYVCEYGFLMVMQCPFNMLWDYQKRACAMKSRAKCYNKLLIN